MSAIIANSQPPPSACPLTAAIIGLRILGIVEDHEAMKLELLALLNVISFISLMSAPANILSTKPGGNRLEYVIPTCKGLLVAGQNNSPSTVVIIKAPESIVQFVEKRRRKGIQGSRTVESDYLIADTSARCSREGLSGREKIHSGRRLVGGGKPGYSHIALSSVESMTWQMRMLWITCTAMPTAL